MPSGRACEVYSESLLRGLRQSDAEALEPRSSPEVWAIKTAGQEGLPLVSSDLNMEPQTPFHLFMDTVRRSIDFYSYMCVYVHA